MKGKSLAKWKAIPPNGDIVGDYFVPFKTPYDNSRSTPDHKFNVSDFLDAIEENYGNRVGLVVDLTRTDRYYNKRQVERRGIEHFKHPTHGFDDTPSEEETTRFIDKCDAFLRANPNKLIVVHCTHGCNRTGFLICAFLVVMLNYDAFDAVCHFQRARPPGIHKMFVIERILDIFRTRKPRYEVERFLHWEDNRLRQLNLDS